MDMVTVRTESTQHEINLGYRSDLKVIIMTSLYTAPRYKYEAFKSFRADEYISKPLDATMLRTVISKLAPRAAAAGARVV